MPLGNSPASSFHLILGILPCLLLKKIAVALFFVHTPINTINYVIFNKEKLVGTQHTVGFVAHRVIYGSIRVVPGCGYSVCGFRYGVGKPDLWVTCIKPYKVHNSIGIFILIRKNTIRGWSYCDE